MATPGIPYAVSGDLERTRHYMGGCWTFLARGRDTDNRFALIEARLRSGLEPPPHTHTHEDEMYYILEGAMRFVVGQQTFDLKAGDSLYLPRGIAHQFKLRTDTVRILIQIAPSGLEDMFWELSKPADKIDFPPMPAGPPSPEFLEKLKGLQMKFGIMGMENSRIKGM